MTDKKTFKGFSLNSSGDILGAFPTVEIIQERAKDLMNEVTGNINQMTIDYCLKFNIDPDVLIKQKAEIELLQMKNKNKELEKENAELKERLELLNLNANIAVRDLNDLLTKAKEIIREIMKYEIPTLDYEKAEQFLRKTDIDNAIQKSR